MPSLYVMETGSRIEIEYQRVLVTLEDEILFRVPVHKVDQIILIGRVGVTTPALHVLLERNIPVIFLGAHGKYLGQVTPALSGNLPLRQQQFKRNDDPDFSLSFAKSIVAGKIHNQAVQARRWARYNTMITEEMISALQDQEDEAQKSREMSSLLGIEGSAARAYFSIMQKVIAPEWGFTGRNRQPPKDPVNAILSFGYTLLTYTMCSALQIVGLDPFLGYYHAEGYGRPSLALDLVEEFRAPVIDALVMSMITLGQIHPDNFTIDLENGGVCMDQEARKKFIKGFGKKLSTGIKTREIKRGISYQKHFEVQARKVAHCIEGIIDGYEPYKMR